jgi:hypothetical protein
MGMAWHGPREAVGCAGQAFQKVTPGLACFACWERGKSVSPRCDLIKQALFSLFPFPQNFDGVRTQEGTGRMVRGQGLVFLVSVSQPSRACCRLTRPRFVDGNGARQSRRKKSWQVLRKRYFVTDKGGKWAIVDAQEPDGMDGNARFSSLPLFSSLFSPFPARPRCHVPVLVPVPFPLRADRWMNEPRPGAP